MQTFIAVCLALIVIELGVMITVFLVGIVLAGVSAFATVYRHLRV